MADSRQVVRRTQFDCDGEEEEGDSSAGQTEGHLIFKIGG